MQITDSLKASGDVGPDKT